VLFENSIVCLVVFVCCLFFAVFWFPRIGMRLFVPDLVSGLWSDFSGLVFVWRV